MLLTPFLALATVPTGEQSLSMWTVGAPEISPDGHYIAYLRNSTDWKENAFRSQIWIADLESNRNYPLTRLGNCNQPTWSPDGKRLAFRSNRGGSSQIYVISPNGGEAQPLTKIDTGIGGFAWSPDGKRIALTIADAATPEQKSEEEAFGRFTVDNEDRTMMRLAVMPVPDELPDAPATPTLLTEGHPLTVSSFRWSPDGTRLAFDATPRSGFRYRQVGA